MFKLFLLDKIPVPKYYSRYLSPNISMLEIEMVTSFGPFINGIDLIYRNQSLSEPVLNNNDISIKRRAMTELQL